MIRFLVIAALLFTAFVIGIIVARDDLREDAFKQARTALNRPEKDGQPGNEGRKGAKKPSASGWLSFFSSDSGEHPKQPPRLDAAEPSKAQPPRAEPPRLAPVQAPTDYTNPEERLPVSPAERAQAAEAERQGRPAVNPDRMKKLEERKAERDRILNMTPEERRAYREEKRREQTERRAQRALRMQQGANQNPNSIEDVLQDNP